MRLRNFLSIVPFLVAALAQDEAALITKTPPCAISSCLCVNETLQADLSICVQKSCPWSEQLVAATVENDLCVGYPKQDKSGLCRAVCTALFCIVIPFLAMRLFTRFKISGELFPDDWAIIVAGFWVIVGAGIEITASAKGFGKHFWNVPVDNAQLLLKVFWMLQVVYIIIQVSAKVSLLLWYHRIFRNEKFKRIVRICLGFVGLHGIVFIFVVLFQCIPVRSVWDRSVDGHCANLGAIGYAGAAFSIVEDLVILVLPIPQLNTLQLPLNKKVGLMLMFSVGSFACVTSMVRLKYLAQIDTSFDITWDNANVLIWSVIECAATVICACLPALRPLILQYVPGLYRTAKSTTKSTWNSTAKMRRRISAFELRADSSSQKSAVEVLQEQV
ncbi:uncharacterized protein PAC_14277 [Phialocephala subalpina]|uniref:Rhodopsin domain-containing protein n=1 Tax=Phialocephala subalpina TaxID=576137 RepID=A0A1L7XH55_9HELO|nr:uncharacterized protein PAC_14277 [Phialocephala subalpina]